jgi:hypothetical protein
MKLCKTQIVLVCFFFLATVPAYCQRGTLGLDGGATTDKFGPLSSQTSPEADLEGQVIVLKGNAKNDIPNLVGGGEIDLPEDTSAHASEFAGFVGPEFEFPHNLTIGFHVQARKLYMPSSTYNGQVFGRDNMLFLELPVVVKYKFGPGNKAFVQAQGISEFSPKYSGRAQLASPYPNPSFDHGYMLRGTAGYVFGKWYVKANYETRYLKWGVNISNPFNLYNWRKDEFSLGVGLAF